MSPDPSQAPERGRSERAISMTRKLRKVITEFFRLTGRMDGKIGGQRSLQTIGARVESASTAGERSERAKKAAVASAEARRNGARQRLPTVGPTMEAPSTPATRSEALILADQLLNRLHGYARKGSPIRKNSYQGDLNWIADVLMSVEAGEPDPLRRGE